MFCKAIGFFVNVFMVLLSRTCLAECPGGIMTNGLCWPTEGNELLLGWHGYNSNYAGKIHLAQDIKANEGDKIYAIADGEVLHNRMDVDGYGGFGFDGGGLIIKHQKADGQYFTALYAHLKNISVGTTVKKGQKIAEIGPYVGGTVHLHFGIRFPFNDDDSRWTGYGAMDNDFFDPIDFIENNAPYVDFSDDSHPIEITVRKDGEAAWYPPNVDCFDAEVWFRVTDSACLFADKLVCFDAIGACPSQQ
jgi:hypothetical protein